MCNLFVGDVTDCVAQLRGSPRVSPPMPDGSAPTLADLSLEASGFVDDPLGYVYWAYPWGTPELPYDGPDDWQKTYLDDLGKALRERDWAVVQTAVGAANGAGKSTVI